MIDELNNLLIAIDYDLKERKNMHDQFTDSDYVKGIIDGINICIGVIDKYK